MVLIAAACTGAADGRPSATASPADGSSPAGPASPSPSTVPGPSRDERWAQDVASLVEQLVRIHPDPFHDVARGRFLAAAGRLTDAIASSSDAELLAGLMRLAALPSLRGRDGHLGLWPPDNPDAVRRFPVRLWSFPDGLYVTAARSGPPWLVGARVLRIDGRPVAGVLARVDRLVPRDTRSNLRDARTVFLTSAEVLDGVGMAADAERLTLDVVTAGGAHRAAAIGAVDAATYAAWVDGWELLPPARPGLGFLRAAGRPWSVTAVPGDRAVLVRYNAVQEDSRALVARLRRVVAASAPDRILLDLRVNGGGEAGGFRGLLRYLERARVPLRILIGRLTFSAAASLAVAIDRRIAGATFLGETMGGATSFWANPETVRLPNSGLVVLVPANAFGAPALARGPHELRPDVPVPFTSGDYFGGRDPVLARALA